MIPGLWDINNNDQTMMTAVAIPIPTITYFIVHKYFTMQFLICGSEEPSKVSRTCFILL